MKPPPLPGKHRARNWLAILVVCLLLLPVIVLVTWYASFRMGNASAVRRLEAKVREAGEPLTLEDLAKRFPPVPDAENAALPLMELWAEEQPEFWEAFRKHQRPMPERKGREYDPALPFLGGDVRRVSRTEPLTAEQLSAAGTYLTAQSNHMDRVRLALRRPHFRFPLDVSAGFNMLLPHLAELRTEAQSFRIAGLVAVEEGDIPGAISAVEDAALISVRLAEEPLLISQLVRLACAQLVIDDAQRLLSRHQLSEIQLKRVQDLLVQLKVDGALRSALLSERATSYSVFDPSAMATNFTQLAISNDSEPPNPEIIRAGLGVLSGIGLTAPDQRLMLETMEQAIKLAGQNTPEALREYEQLFVRVGREARRFPPKFFSALLLPSLEKAGTRFATFEARRRAALTAVAIERYRLAHNGEVPDTLSGLVPEFFPSVLLDPFDGKSLGLATREPGYTIYSVGPDREDNQGKERPEKGPTKPFDVTFIVERNHAKTNASSPAPGGLQQTTPFASGTEGYHTFRIPAMVVNGDGHLLAFCEGRKGGSGDAGDIDTVMKHSPDGGRTWSPLRVVWDDGTNTCGNPCVVRDAQTGVIWLLQTWNQGDDREPRIIDGTSKDTRRVFVTRSDDEGRTWAKPNEITADVKLTNWTWYATGPGAGIQLQRGPHQGRLIIPCDHIEAGTRRYFSHVIFSDDHGQNWKLGGSTPRDLVNECEAVELADGRLMLNMRSYDPSQKARQSAISRDSGITWEEQKLVPELVDPICQASIRRLAWPTTERPGVILFSNPASQKRERLTVRASFDDGNTWPISRLLSPSPAAYSCLVTMPDGSIGIFYETGSKNPYQTLVFSRFTLDWLKQTAPP